MALQHREPESGATGEMRTGVTGSFPSRPSPEMCAGASLPSRILRFRERSRVRAGLAPEPSGDRRALERKPGVVPAGPDFRCSRLFWAGARGGGVSPCACAVLGRQVPPPCATFSIFARLLVCQSGNGGVISVVLFFFPPAHWVWFSGYESGFWKSLWKVSGM